MGDRKMNSGVIFLSLYFSVMTFPVILESGNN